MLSELRVIARNEAPKQSRIEEFILSDLIEIALLTLFAMIRERPFAMTCTLPHK